MPKNTLVINCDIRETRVALIEGGVIAELQVERAAHRGSVGNIVLGKVTRVLPGMQAAFIDIGMERAAFLHVEDLIRPDDFEAYLAGGGSRSNEDGDEPIRGDAARRADYGQRPATDVDEDDDDEPIVAATPVTRGDEDDDDEDDEDDVVTDDEPVADAAAENEPEGDPVGNAAPDDEPDSEPDSEEPDDDEDDDEPSAEDAAPDGEASTEAADDGESEAESEDEDDDEDDESD